MVIFNLIKGVTHISRTSDNMDGNTLGEWSDGDDDWIWDVDESTLWEWSDPEADDIIRNIQTGRGEKRKSDEPLLPEKDFYEKESVTKHKSKKFRMTATDHTIRFNNVLSELDLIESYERTQAIFEHLLNECNSGYEQERSGTVRVTFRPTGHTYLITFHGRRATYTRTGFLPN